MKIGGLRLHGSARCYTLRRSQDRKASAFAPAFLSCRPSPCTALLDCTAFAVPRLKSLCFHSGFSLFRPSPARLCFLRRCFRRSPARLCSTVQPSPFPARKASAFAPAFLSSGIRPARLCSTVQPSPFPARKAEVFSGCGRSPYKKIGHLPFESKLSSALTDLFARLSAYPKFLILNSFSASRF